MSTFISKIILFFFKLYMNRTDDKCWIFVEILKHADVYEGFYDQKLYMIVDTMGESKRRRKKRKRYFR